MTLMAGHSQSDLFADGHVLAAAMRLPAYEEALARLLYLVERQRPCGVLLGPHGIGKSLMLVALIQELSGHDSSGWRCRPILIEGPGSGIAWRLAAKLGLPVRRHESEEALWRIIEDRFDGATLSSMPVVPVIDHLNGSDPRCLSDLSRLCGLASRSGGTVVLSARPPLNAALREIIGPLCDLRIELPLWSPNETSAFVAQMLSESRFPELDARTLTAIHACTGGRLRDTVQVLRLSVFAADSQELDRLDADVVRMVAGEIWRPAIELPDAISKPATSPVVVGVP